MLNEIYLTRSKIYYEKLNFTPLHHGITVKVKIQHSTKSIKTSNDENLKPF